MNCFSWLRSAWFWIAAWVLFVVVASSMISVLFWDWLSAGESGSTAVRNVGLVIAAVIALPLAVWRSMVAERQADTARTQAETAERGLLNERYQKGAEMLGSEVLSVRLGGIYALQRLAEENPKQYHIQVMRLFCGFVRHPVGNYVAAEEPIRGEPLTASAEFNVGWDKSGEEDKQGITHTEGDKIDLQNRVREDVQAIMEAIGTRNEVQIKLERESKYVPKLSRADLRSLRLGDANLSGVELVEANLSDAVLLKVDFSNAKLYEANLSGVNLAGANLSNTLLFHADLSSASAIGTNFSNAHLLSANLNQAELIGANLTGTVLTHANLAGAIFYKDGLLAKGLTQQQIAFAVAIPEEKPPLVYGLIDAETGDLIDWSKRPRVIKQNLPRA